MPADACLPPALRYVYDAAMLMMLALRHAADDVFMP